MVHNLYLQATTLANKVRVTLSAPTGNPRFYYLPTIVNPIEGRYEAQIAVGRRFNLKSDCNNDYVSLRQCQLICRRKFLYRQCPFCQPASLDTQMLGFQLPYSSQFACTIADYDKCSGSESTSTDRQEMKQCVDQCRPPCTYVQYEFTSTSREGEPNGTTLIAPVNDFVDFDERPAYSWFKVIAECGGLMYVCSLVCNLKLFSGNSGSALVLSTFCTLFC